MALNTSAGKNSYAALSGPVPAGTEDRDRARRIATLVRKPIRLRRHQLRGC
jgi:hypothetical protein